MIFYLFFLTVQANDSQFLVFHERGISVYDPTNCRLQHQIQATDIIPGTQVITVWVMGAGNESNIWTHAKVYMYLTLLVLCFPFSSYFHFHFLTSFFAVFTQPLSLFIRMTEGDQDCVALPRKTKLYTQTEK